MNTNIWKLLSRSRVYYFQIFRTPVVYTDLLSYLLSSCYGHVVLGTTEKLMQNTLL